MMEEIQAENADIICMQEFFHSIDPTWYPNLTYISKHFNYPYYVYSHDNDGDKHFIGNVIFSRYPIIDSALIRYPRPTLPESLVHADIKVNDDTIRVYTTHLQSLQLQASDYEKIDQIKKADEGIVSNSRTIFSKLKTGISYRKDEGWATQNSGSRVFQLGRLVQLGVLGAAGTGLIAWLLLS